MCQAVQTIEEALTTRLLQSTIHTLELYRIYLGKGFFRLCRLRAR